MKYYEETLPNGVKRTFIGSPPARPQGPVVEINTKEVISSTPPTSPLQWRKPALCTIIGLIIGLMIGWLL